MSNLLNIVFLYPSFLWALTLLSIPIIIYLFNFRRYKKVYFSNVGLLKEVQESSKAANKVKHWLILLFRLIAIASLVLAFAMPVIPLNNQTVSNKSTVHSFYLDNSFSMNGEHEQGRIFDVARGKVEALVKNMPNHHFYQILTNDFEGKHRHAYSKEEFLQIIQDIQESPSHKDFNQIASRLKSNFEDSEKENAIYYWVSDFQKNTLDESAIAEIDTSMYVNLLPIKPTESNNLVVDSVWFESPFRVIGKSDKVKVRIVNRGDNNLENIPVKLLINNQQKAISSFNINAQGEKEIELNFTIAKEGDQYCRIEIEDYPIVFDNSIYFAFYVQKEFKLLCINEKEEAKWINSIFSNDSLVAVTQSNQNKIDYAEIASYDLIVLNQLNSFSSGLLHKLDQFRLDGGNVFIIPTADSKRIDAYTELCALLNIDQLESAVEIEDQVKDINYESVFFRDVFRSINKDENVKMRLPTAFKYYALKGKKQNREDLMTMSSHVFLSRYVQEKSNIYLLSASTDKTSSNIVRQAIIVPMLYRMVQLRINPAQLYYTINSNLTIKLSGKQADLVSEGKLELKNKSGVGIIPKLIKERGDVYLGFGNKLKQDGNYSLMNGMKEIGKMSLNYDRKESDLSFFTNDEIKQFATANKQLSFITLDDIKSQSDISLNKSLWEWFLITALLFLGAEILFHRLSK